MLALFPTTAAYGYSLLSQPQPHRACSRARPVCASESVASPATGSSYATKKAALIEGLKREYSSFFNPMEMELYDPQVSFDDPMISFTGAGAFKANVDMLSGGSAVGKLLFDDPGLVMHTVTEESERQLTTRWTLQFRFKLLPWRPLAQFTGVSQYTLDEQARVVRQAQLVEKALRLRPATHRPPSWTICWLGLLVRTPEHRLRLACELAVAPLALLRPS